MLTLQEMHIEIARGLISEPVSTDDSNVLSVEFSPALCQLNVQAMGASAVLDFIVS